MSTISNRLSAAWRALTITPSKVRLDAKEPRGDGWSNVITALGIANRDKRTAGRMEVTPLPHEQLLALWRGDDIAGRIVELLPREMLREGWRLQVDTDATESAKLQKSTKAKLDDLRLNERLMEALCFERAFGGGAILIGADDGAKDLSQPLDINRLRSIKWLTSLHKEELYPYRWYQDPSASRYGEVELWRIQPEMGGARQVVVHESRLLLFSGIRTTRRQLVTNNGWGDPVLLRVFDVVRDFAQAFGGTAALLTDFSQAVFKIKDLSDLIASNNDQVLIDRVTIIDKVRSIIRAVVIDKDEEFERKSTPISGLDSLLDKFSLRVASAAETPVSLLMGQAPAGLNATGDSDIRWWYDNVHARQGTKVKPPVERLLKLLFLSKDGPTGGKEPESWQILFNPLWQETESEKVDKQYKQAQADEIYIRNSVATPEEIAVSRFGGDGYSTDTVLDLDARRVAPQEKEKEEVPS